MHKTDREYQKCIQILKEELSPAMGCTEPIALAYCAAIARSTLGHIPDSIVVEVSGNIIKNAKSVVVPNTGGMRGVISAVAAGIIAGDAGKALEVISTVSREDIVKIEDYKESVNVELRLSDSTHILDIIITACYKDSYAKVRITDYHTNIVLIEKDGQQLFANTNVKETNELTDRSFLTVEKILDFANTVDIQDVKQLLDTQIEYNMAIAEEGLRGDYGANIGSLLLSSNDCVAGEEHAIYLEAKAKAAAASDARMNGCDLPVIINCGSGNQGITVSVPVIVYAEAKKITRTKLYRALVLSNLLAIHMKTPIGVLSAYCGAVSAGAAAGCGIAYIKDGSLNAISHTIVNALAIASGIICDGAKASCAGKIALAVENGILGYLMYENEREFYGGDGIVKQNVENTIKSVGKLASRGMKETDKEILNIMINL